MHPVVIPCSVNSGLILFIISIVRQNPQSSFARIFFVADIIILWSVNACCLIYTLLLILSIYTNRMEYYLSALDLFQCLFTYYAINGKDTFLLIICGPRRCTGMYFLRL